MWELVVAIFKHLRDAVFLDVFHSSIVFIKRTPSGVCAPTFENLTHSLRAETNFGAETKER